MDSHNFEILRKRWPELATLGGFAEQYTYTDAPSALIKLRTFSEQLVERIYHAHSLPLPYQRTLFDLLAEDSFKETVPKVVLDKFHQIRLDGNKAAHGQKTDNKTALFCLREAWDLGRWYFITYGKGSADQCPPYQEPSPEDTKAKLKKEKKAALKKLALQEAQLQELLQQFETLRVQAKAAKKNETELMALKTAGQAAADVLKFDEATTRKRLIDKQLIETGWTIDPNGGNTSEVTMEEKIPHQPTPSSMGYADYVLWDDTGKPLAVIEAKKTSVNPEKGRTQAKLYADGLEKKHGQRPVIFYTNGFDIYIWDDVQNYPPRRLFGFYSKDSLQYLVQQRQTKQPLDKIKPKKEIIGKRLYQIEAIQAVCERFSAKHRKALIVQATGTGKTRVATALTDVLVRANWGIRILFLCDRLELRKQAKNTFTDFMSEPLTLVTAKTAQDRNKRIYLATYPAMMKTFQTFDTGFFDLIIADESHRSIYNRYQDLFKWFDCLQVGLTATPLDKINRNTFKLFDCPDKKPTVYYSLEKAVEEEYLVPYEVYSHTTAFLREGIKFTQLTDGQKEELEDAGEVPELFNYDPKDLDKKIFNRDTNREIIQNLMKNAIRDGMGQLPGKTIIFARNHNHAVLLAQVFDELYPQYGGKFCHVIDNYDPRAEQLIDDFKDTTNSLTIAVSVDMLDTGIDVPEVVNLVFAKPIFSWVKFWQMLGRGTRLCKNLFGPGKHKSKFRIFDHWGNFERFEIEQPEPDPSPSKSIMQLVFESRINLAETALSKADLDTVRQTVELIRKDINSLPDNTIAVKEKWKEKNGMLVKGVLDQFAPVTVTTLKSDIAPLMQWVYTRDHSDAYSFDLLVTSAQNERLRQSGRFEDFKDQIQNMVTGFSKVMHLTQVMEKADLIKKVVSSNFWDDTDVAKLEEMRRGLRSIMHYRQKGGQPQPLPKEVDISDGEVEVVRRTSNIRSIDMQLYRQMVEETLEKLFETSPVLKKIRRGDPVSENDLEKLVSLVLTQNPDVNLKLLHEFFPESAMPLDFIIRTIVGMEPEAVEKRFASFARKFAENSRQTHFLRLLKNHIQRYGAITVEKLYEEPFTKLASDGLDGVFSNDFQIDELINIIETFQPQTGATA
ncbi:DEAD/DEAH box helicase family protein [Desulfobacterales bacterium HSG17]|nr:DEAD/DEAH box helicase family protein [Desulfobacterales bacterium HSG17]